MRPCGPRPFVSRKRHDLALAKTMEKPDPSAADLPSPQEEMDLNAPLAHIRSIYDAMPLGALLAAADGSLIHVNPAFESMSGKTADELFALGFKGVCAFLGLRVPDIGRECLLEQSETWHKARQIAPRQDGPKAWLRVHLAVVRGPQGVWCVQLLSEDVTRQHRLLANFSKRRQYKSLVERRLDPICRFLPDWSILFANAAYCRAFGRKRREIVGDNFLHLLSLEDRQLFIRAAGAITPQNPAVDVEHRLMWLESQPVWIKWTIQGFFYKTGHIKDYQAVGVDITSHKLAWERVVQADRLVSLGTLVSGVAHEINNPNNFIMLNAPLVRDLWERVVPLVRREAALTDDPVLAGIVEDVPQLLAGIAEGAARIRAIVGELKEFARHDDRREFDFVQINDVVPQALKLLSKTIASCTTAFRATYAPDLPPVKGNPQRLEQVVVNLVHNACLAIDHSGQALEVETFYHQPTLSVRILVRDHGVGMTPEVLAMVAEPFFSTRRAQGGTGLGLSICRQILKEHGGNLLLESAPGKGTTAHVVLPVAF